MDASHPSPSPAASPAPPPKAYTVAEAARAARLGRSHLYLAIRDGRLVARKAGRRTLVLARDLDAFLNALPQAHAA